MKNPTAWIAAVSVLVAGPATAQVPAPKEGTWTVRDVRFADGQTLPEVRLHYRTLGSPRRDAGRVVNAVLILHGTGGSGAQFLQPQFAGELTGPGQLLDASRHFLILPDAVGHGGSSKPSDGLRMRFPRYDYEDMVRLQHRLVTEHLGVDHLRLVMGTSMGGMHAWIWGYRHPEMMDGLVPLASVPTAIAGRNRVWRKMLMDSIRDDPAWAGGEYQKPPRIGLRAAVHLLMLVGSVPIQWHRLAPTRDAADRFLAEQLDRRVATADANDMLYQFDASRDYDPSPHLERIAAPVLAINSADDVINPPELGLMETLMPRVKRGTYVLIPTSDRTRGHSTHTWAAVWRDHLARFLASIDGAPAVAASADDDARQVEALERELIAAIGGGDLVAYDRLVADDYVALRPAGDQTKSQVIATYRSAALAYRGLDIHDVSVKLLGDTAVLSARTSGTRIEDGKESPNRVRYLRVWARRDGGWRAVLQMAAPLPPG
jgi:homoserine O-acetyltransferase